MAEPTNPGLIGRISHALSAARRAREYEEELARTNPYLIEALDSDKREGLILAVRARWVALAIITFVPGFVLWFPRLLGYQG